MLIYFFTIIVYVFFIYGVIEFMKKVIFYSNKEDREIQVYIDDPDDLEYKFNVLKKEFDRVVFIIHKDDKELDDVLNVLSRRTPIVTKYIEDISKTEKS